MNIANKLKQYRLDKNMTQAEVAEKLMVSRKTVSGWENGRSIPEITTLARLSDLYQVPIDTIIRDDQDILGPYTVNNHPSSKSIKIYNYTYGSTFIFLILAYFQMYGFFHSILIMLGLLTCITIIIMIYPYWKIYANKKRLALLLISYLVLIISNILLMLLDPIFLKSMTDNEYANAGLIFAELLHIIFISSGEIVIIFLAPIRLIKFWLLLRHKK
ncbi:helix-turn-helix transcriptional regulator [Lactobacillus sp. DCY120]|uniref:Helix-turn-helix transcriptional regulator n=1 Tax=Bombilactobacillus apium TaxID=2675299 RepID=A0A850R3J4_9LACO|nr:helix-turn-helix transcriptional regulator [Bombilactobacillus apium]NVY96541.1 helix-turn-helix transcriptional regulator [Bombilactobacillus apium]